MPVEPTADPNKLRWRLRQVGDVVIIDIDGRLVFGSGFEIRKVVDKALADGQTRLLVNMERVRYMDSYNVGDLVVSLRVTIEHGGHLKLLKLQPKQRKLLEYHRLLDVFEHFEDEQQALASFD